MVLSRKQIKNVCKYGTGQEECKYLLQDELDANKFHCVKKYPKKKAEIDEAYVKVAEKLKTQGIKLENQNIPLGDHCEGYIILHHIEQGYDKK